MTTNNAVNNLDNFVGFSAFLSADIDLATGAGTELTLIYDTVISQKDCIYDNTNGVFTCTNPGLYEFIAVTHYEIDPSFTVPFSNKTFQSRIKVFSETGMIYYFNSSFNLCTDINSSGNAFEPQYQINKTGPILLSAGDTVYHDVYGDNAPSNNIDILFSLGTYTPGDFQKVGTYFSGYKVGSVASDSTTSNAINSVADPFVGFHAYLGADLINVIGNNDTIPLEFQEIIVNPQSNYNSGTALYTCDRTGLYDIGGMITFMVDSPIWIVSNSNVVIAIQAQSQNGQIQSNAIIQIVNNPLMVYQPVSIPFKSGQYYLLEEGMIILFTATSNGGGSDNINILSTVTGLDIASHIWIKYIGDVA